MSSPHSRLIEQGITCTCHACGKSFGLLADAPAEPLKKKWAYLAIKSCDSGGIYGIQVECPHCNYVHSLY